MCAKKKVNFPKYVIFGGTTAKTGTTMRLESIAENGLSATYYRDAGAWSTKAKYIDGVLTSFGWPRGAEWGYLNNKILVETTRTIWKNSNKD